MNLKKPHSDPSWFPNEVRALRSEEPREESVDRAVWAMQTPPVKTSVNPHRRLVWRTAASVAAIGTLLVFLAARPQVASAADLHKIAEVMRAHKTRYMQDYRPDAQGKLFLYGESWVEGDKQLMSYPDVGGGTKLVGYDGKRMFILSGDGDGTIDDVQPSTIPIEDLDVMLSIPGCKVEGVQKNQGLDGRTVDIYSLSFNSIRFILYVDQKSGLPIRRDVLTMKGKLTEQDRYEYPADIPDTKFQPPVDKAIRWHDYTMARNEFAKKLDDQGQTKELNGVKITLRAVIVGKSQVVALWTGGAKTDYDANGHISVEGLSGGFSPGFIHGSVWPVDDPERPPLFVDGQPLIGDAIWYQPPLDLEAPFTISVPVWVEDRTKPLISKEGIRVRGYHSKLLGKLDFRVDSPIYTSDPERLMWRPGDNVVKSATTVSK